MSTSGTDVLNFFGKVVLVLGVTVLIPAFFGALILLLDTHGAGFWEVTPMVQYIPFFAWGTLLTSIGYLLLSLAYYYDRTPAHV